MRATLLRSARIHVVFFLDVLVAVGRTPLICQQLGRRLRVDDADAVVGRADRQLATDVRVTNAGVVAVKPDVWRLASMHVRNATRRTDTSEPRE